MAVVAELDGAPPSKAEPTAPADPRRWRPSSPAPQEPQQELETMEVSRVVAAALRSVFTCPLCPLQMPGASALEHITQCASRPNIGNFLQQTREGSNERPLVSRGTRHNPATRSVANRVSFLECKAETHTGPPRLAQSIGVGSPR